MLLWNGRPSCSCLFPTAVTHYLSIYLITYNSRSHHDKRFINIIMDMRVEHAREGITAIESHGRKKRYAIVAVSSTPSEARQSMNVLYPQLIFRRPREMFGRDL